MTFFMAAIMTRIDGFDPAARWAKFDIFGSWRGSASTSWSQLFRQRSWIGILYCPRGRTRICLASSLQGCRL